MLTIHLQKLQFFSYHGIHEEEKMLGNNYEINATIQFYQPEKIESINQTLDYVIVYELIKKRMEEPTRLLETIAQEVTEQIRQLDERIKSINISITKLHPPIENFEGTVGVSWFKEY